MHAAKRISVRIEAALESRLRRRAALTKKSESEIVREALGTYLGDASTEPTAYDIAKRARLIGCVKAAPRDLSTNPKYLEGFGKE